jgi:hypothetical protein
MAKTASSTAPGTVGPFVYRIDPDSGKRYLVLAHYANSALPPLEAALVREAAPRPAAEHARRLRNASLDHAKRPAAARSTTTWCRFYGG